MSDWAIYLGWEFKNLFQRMVTYEELGSDMVKIELGDSIQNVSVKDIHKVKTPAFNYGDTVSPAEKPDIIGVVVNIGYQFRLKEPFFNISVDGEYKSKRYFKGDLLLRD